MKNTNLTKGKTGSRHVPSRSRAALSASCPREAGWGWGDVHSLLLPCYRQSARASTLRRLAGVSARASPPCSPWASKSVPRCFSCEERTGQTAPASWRGTFRWRACIRTRRWWSALDPGLWASNPSDSRGDRQQRLTSCFARVWEFSRVTGPRSWGS